MKQPPGPTQETLGEFLTCAAPSLRHHPRFSEEGEVGDLAEECWGPNRVP